MKISKYVPLILGMALLLSSCDAFVPVPTPTPTLVPTPTSTDVPPTATSLPPTSTFTPEPTPSATPIIPVCLPVREGRQPLAQESFENYPAVILRFLNDGGSPEEMAAAFFLRKMNSNNEPVVVRELTGDGKRDVLVNVLNPDAPSAGMLLIFSCFEETYRLGYAQFTAPQDIDLDLLLIQDLNADGLEDLIVTSKSCGAHTCVEEIRILIWDGETFQNRLVDGTDELPSPSAKISDFDGDGIYNLEVTTGGFSSVGAGPQRESTYVYEYDSESGTWIYADQLIGPSSFRIHKVHDADAAMKRGEYAIASLLFEQVIADAALEESVLLDWLNPILEKQILSAYSSYKRIVAATLAGDLAHAEALLEEFHLQVDDGDQAVFAELAEVFIFAYGTGGIGPGCSAAQAFAAQNYSVILAPLGAEIYGYANLNYTPDDICP